MLFLALAAALAVSLLGIRSRALSALSGALMAAFLAVGYTFSICSPPPPTASPFFFGGPLRLPGQKGPVALAGRLSAPGLLHGHLSGLCDGGHRPVPAGHFPGDPDLSASFLRHPAPGGGLMLFLAAGAVLYYGILLVFLQVKDLELLSYLGWMPPAPAIPSPASRAAAGHLQAGGGFLLPARFRQHLHLRLDGRAGSGRAGAGRGCFLLCMGQEGLWRARWRPLGGLAMLALLLWASTSARSSAPGPPPPP